MMRFNELRDGDIVVVNYSLDPFLYGRPTVFYVVMGDVAVSFKGDVNCGKRPMGWYQKEGNLPQETIAVYRPKHITNTFNGDFENDEIYDCLWRREDF